MLFFYTGVVTRPPARRHCRDRNRHRLTASSSSLGGRAPSPYLWAPRGGQGRPRGPSGNARTPGRCRRLGDNPEPLVGVSVFPPRRAWVARNLWGERLNNMQLVKGVKLTQSRGPHFTLVKNKRDRKSCLSNATKRPNGWCINVGGFFIQNNNQKNERDNRGPFHSGKIKESIILIDEGLA